jgi:hypothetical protein
VFSADSIVIFDHFFGGYDVLSSGAPIVELTADILREKGCIECQALDFGFKMSNRTENSVLRIEIC